MVVSQFVHTLSYGDAISGEVLSINRAIKERGEVSHIFALNVHPKLEHLIGGSVTVVKPDSWREEILLNSRFTESDTIILHYSLGSLLNQIYLELNQPKRVLIYHNITPSKWYDSINRRVADDIKDGIGQLPELARISDELWADSEFNQSELSALGFESKVLPLPLDPTRWELESNSGVAQILSSDPSKHILHVGRLAPNKSIEDLLKIFYFFHHYVCPASKLWLVGIDIDTELYSFALTRFAYELGVEDVVNFTGGVSDGELKSYYQHSDAYLCMSEHEGFCVPILEALHFGLPVFAYDAGAVRGTLGGAGFLFQEKRHAEIAEFMGYVLEQPDLVDSAINAGRVQESRFTFEKFGERLFALLG